MGVIYGGSIEKVYRINNNRGYYWEKVVNKWTEPELPVSLPP